MRHYFVTIAAMSVMRAHGFRVCVRACARLRLYIRVRDIIGGVRVGMGYFHNIDINVVEYVLLCQ